MLINRRGIENIRKTFKKKLKTLVIDSKGDFPDKSSGPKEKKTYKPLKNHPKVMEKNTIVRLP